MHKTKIITAAVILFITTTTSVILINLNQPYLAAIILLLLSYTFYFLYICEIEEKTASEKIIKLKDDLTFTQNKVIENQREFIDKLINFIEELGIKIR